MKEFKVGNDDFATVCHWQTPTGKLVIDVYGVTLSSAQAIRLSKWLVEAVQYCGEQNSTRKREILAGEKPDEVGK